MIMCKYCRFSSFSSILIPQSVVQQQALHYYNLLFTRTFRHTSYHSASRSAQMLYIVFSSSTFFVVDV